MIEYTFVKRLIFQATSIIFMLFELCFICGCSNGTPYYLKDYNLNELFDDPNIIILCKASANGDVANIEKIVEKGIDIDTPGLYGVTALMWSLWNSNYRGFEKLVELGANPNVHISSGSSVISMAAEKKDSRFLKKALESGGDPDYQVEGSFKTPLIMSIFSGNTNNISLLIEFGVDLNRQDFSGDTPLIVAASTDQYNIVYMLLEAGADYKIKNVWGKTILDSIENGALKSNSKSGFWRRKSAEFLRSKCGQKQDQEEGD